MFSAPFTSALATVLQSSQTYNPRSIRWFPSFVPHAEHVFENREAIDGDEDAIEESVSFLEENTNLDAAAIREDAESGAYDQRMAFDEDAAGRSNVDATPYFHLFRDGEHRTEIRGYQEYQIFANTLEL